MGAVSFPCFPFRTDAETGERVDKEEIMVGKPLRFSGTPAAPVGRGPLVGQHNDEILQVRTQAIHQLLVIDDALVDCL